MYKYVTDDNLENKQNYMYSKFDGKSFLNEYIASREIIRPKKKDSIATSKKSDVKAELEHLYNLFADHKMTDYDFEVVDKFLKSFEVRKRLYSQYTETMKPTEGADYRDYDIYLIMAACLVEAYRITGNLKYVNCLLKMDDTLLSVYSEFSSEQYDKFSKIIADELEIVRRIAMKNNVALGVGGNGLN